MVVLLQPLATSSPLSPYYAIVSNISYTTGEAVLPLSTTIDELFHCSTRTDSDILSFNREASLPSFFGIMPTATCDIAGQNAFYLGTRVSSATNTEQVELTSFQYDDWVVDLRDHEVAVEHTGETKTVMDDVISEAAGHANEDHNGRIATDEKDGVTEDYVTLNDTKNDDAKDENGKEGGTDEKKDRDEKGDKKDRDEKDEKDEKEKGPAEVAQDENLAPCNAIPPTTGKRKWGVSGALEKGSRFNPIMIDNEEDDAELPEKYHNLYDDVPPSAKKSKRNTFTLPEEVITAQ